MPHNIRLFSDVGAKMSMFDNKAKLHKENQMINPFSDWDGSGTRRKLSRDDPDYGKPVEGSKTAERGRQAQLQMISDMVELCDLIFDCGVRSPDGRGAICFGDVFRLYSQINDKCVGLLMRGRKHNILDFEGEMLFQRRDDHKMIELLLPLNTIRYKYGMQERAGCGEVRPDLLDELERQQREKHPARCRSMEQLGLPPPQLHKSRSMELTRDTTKGDDGWQLTVETPSAAAGRMGHSADNLTHITEDEGAAGGVFTAVPEGAVGGGEDTAGDVLQGTGKDGAAESGLEKDSAAGKAPVKWVVDSDDEDDEKVQEKQENVSAAAPVMWPEVKIVVEGDEDVNADMAENDGDAKEDDAEQGISDEVDKESENVYIKVGEAPERASLSNAASLAPESESDFDFWASTEQDSWSGAVDNDKSGIKSAVQTPRLKTPERTPSPSLTEADQMADTATKSNASNAEETSEENADRGVEQPTAEAGAEAVPDQPKEEEKIFSFWDVPDEAGESMKKVPEDVDDSRSNASPGETQHDDKQTEKDSGFSFWDVPEDDETTEKDPKLDEAERGTGEETNDCSETSLASHPKERDTKGSTENVISNEDQDKGGGSTLDVAQETSNDVPATNGENFSFWDVSAEDEGVEQTPAFPRSKTNLWDDDDTAETPDPSAAETNKPDDPSSVDSTCCGRVPSQTGDEWDATSAEHPSPAGSGSGGGPGDPDRVSPRPLAVPHITLFDDSELMPAR